MLLFATRVLEQIAEDTGETDAEADADATPEDVLEDRRQRRGEADTLGSATIAPVRLSRKLCFKSGPKW